MILIEVTAAVDAAGALQTLYLSDADFITEPSDTPANTAFLSRLKNSGTIGLHVYSDGKTGGASKLETGTITVANIDGEFDHWKDFSFDGRPLVIRSGTGGAYPSAFGVVFTGTVESVEVTWDLLIIRLRDKQFIFDRPVAATRYAGTNVGPLGLEGTSADLKDKPKPWTRGAPPNIPAPCVNTSKLAYQVNNGVVTSIVVFDRGLELVAGTDHADSAALVAATVTAGEYDTCLAEGYFRLGSAPSGQVTADVVQGATEVDRTVAQTLQALALAAGLTPAEISAEDVAALDALNPAVIGLYVADDETFRSAMDRVAASIGAYFIFDPLGVLRMGVLTAPEGSPLLTLYDYDIGDDVQIKPARDKNIPVWSVTVRHTKLGLVQATDLAGSVDAERRAYLAQEYRSAKYEDAAIKDQYLLATEMQVDTLLTGEDAADAEAERRFRLHSVGRLRFDVSAPIDLLTANGVWLARVIALDLNRFGLAGGRSFRVLDIALDLSKQRAFLNIWG
jgi:hypothetical protein